MIFFFFLNYLFIWLHWVLVAASGIFIRSLVAARALLLCGMWDLNSLTKDWTPIPYITGQILNQWTSREVPEMIFFFFFQQPKCLYWILSLPSGPGSGISICGTSPLGDLGEMIFLPQRLVKKWLSYIAIIL